MSFTTSALGAIQKTGASAHRAAMALQDAKKKAAADLAKAITSSADQNAEISPDQLNALNGIGRLAERMRTVEQDLVAIFREASELVSPKKTTSTTPSPTPAAKTEVTSSPQTKVKAKVKTSAPNAKGHSDRLLVALQEVLNTSTFTTLKQTALAKKAGIPTGSMTAVLKKLIASSRLATDGKGGYKLTVEATTSAAAPQDLKDRAAKKVSPKSAKKPVTETGAVVGAVAKKSTKPQAKKQKPAVKVQTETVGEPATVPAAEVVT